MNNASTQAQKGFKTFLLTLSVSLVVFSVIYYFVTDGLSTDSAPIAEKTDTAVATAPTAPEVAGDSTVAEDPIVAEEVVTTFGKLLAVDPGVNEPAVLAGADTQVGGGGSMQTTQSTVPETGVVGITMGLLTSLTLFVFVMVYIFTTKKNFSLARFEEQFLKDPSDEK